MNQNTNIIGYNILQSKLHIMAFQHSCILILLFPLLTQLTQCRLTQDTFNTAFETSSNSYGYEGTNWAVLIAGSQGYGNYRHQVQIKSPLVNINFFPY